MIKLTLDVPEKFLGIKFKEQAHTFEECSCVGICWLYLKENGFDVPFDDGAEISRDWASKNPRRMIEAMLKIGDMAPSSKIQKFDVVLFNLNKLSRWPDHCGVMVSHRHFLHIRENKLSCIQQMDAFWKSRLLGAMRISERRYLPEGFEVRLGD
jgi:hypothetical protein